MCSTDSAIGCMNNSSQISCAQIHLHRVVILARFSVQLSPSRKSSYGKCLIMAKLNQALNELRSEKKRIQNELSQLDGAIVAITKLAGRSSENGRSTNGRRGSRRGKRTLSASARRRIAAAQRARWAKFRQQHKKAA